MEQKSIKISENKEFLTSERWKCKKSPTGAHHWMINLNQMTCKYCNDTKPVTMTGPGYPKTESK